MARARPHPLPCGPCLSAALPATPASTAHSTHQHSASPLTDRSHTTGPHSHLTAPAQSRSARSRASPSTTPGPPASAGPTLQPQRRVTRPTPARPPLTPHSPGPPASVRPLPLAQLRARRPAPAPRPTCQRPLPPLTARTHSTGSSPSPRRAHATEAAIPARDLAGFLLERARRDPGALFKPPRGPPCSPPIYSIAAQP